MKWIYMMNGWDECLPLVLQSFDSDMCLLYVDIYLFIYSVVLPFDQIGSLGGQEAASYTSFYSQGLDSCLVHRRCSINVWWQWQKDRKFEFPRQAYPIFKIFESKISSSKGMQQWILWHTMCNQVQPKLLWQRHPKCFKRKGYFFLAIVLKGLWPFLRCHLGTQAGIILGVGFHL